MKGGIYRRPLVAAITSAVACLTWSLANSLYIGHLNSGGDRYDGIDVAVISMALVTSFDKIGAGLANALFVYWWADEPTRTLIGSGLMHGTAFGFVGGAYLVLWAGGNALHEFLDLPTRPFLHVVWMIVVLLNVGATVLAAAYASLLIVSFDLAVFGEIAMYALFGFLLSISVFSMFAYLGFWSVRAGQQLTSSLGMKK